MAPEPQKRLLRRIFSGMSGAEHSETNRINFIRMLFHQYRGGGAIAAPGAPHQSFIRILTVSQDLRAVPRRRRAKNAPELRLSAAAGMTAPLARALILTQHAIAILVETIKPVLRRIDEFGAVDKSVVVLIRIAGLALRLTPRFHFLARQRTVAVGVSLFDHFSLPGCHLGYGEFAVAIGVKPLPSLISSFHNPANTD